MNKLPVGECIRFGWDTLKKRPLIIIGAFVLAFVISGVSSSLLTPSDGTPASLTTTLMSIASAIIGIFIEIGLVTFALRAHDNVETVKIQDMWNPSVFLRYLGGQILVGIIVVVGLILIIVPGIIAALGLMFTSYLIVDKGRGPIEALKESWHMTKGHKMELLAFVAAIVLLNIVGLIALIVGLLITIPVSMLAIAHAYRKIAGMSSSSTPVPVA